MRSYDSSISNSPSDGEQDVVHLQLRTLQLAFMHFGADVFEIGQIELVSFHVQNAKKLDAVVRIGIAVSLRRSRAAREFLGNLADLQLSVRTSGELFFESLVSRCMKKRIATPRTKDVAERRGIGQALSFGQCLPTEQSERVEQVGIEAGKPLLGALELFVARLARGLHLGDKCALHFNRREGNEHVLQFLSIDVRHANDLAADPINLRSPRRNIEKEGDEIWKRGGRIESNTHEIRCKDPGTRFAKDFAFAD